jgi:outer membrane beta-barrel protein
VGRTAGWCAVVLAAASLGAGGVRAQAAAAAPPADRELAAEGAQDDAAATGATEEGTGLPLQPRIRGVSRHVFLKGGRFEAAPLAGITTNDPFYRRWQLGGRVSYHLNDVFSVDVGGAGVLFDEFLDPAPILGQLSTPVLDTAKLFGYADAGVTFSPVYGKVAVMAEWVIHFDTFVSGGLGATFDTTTTIVHPALELGIGSRVFLTRWLCLRTDLRDYIYPQDRGQGVKVQNLLNLNVGVGIFFPFDFEYGYEAAKVSG